MKSSSSAMECLYVPAWLESLLSITFFSLCNVHTEKAKNDCKMFCLDCNNHKASCVHCIASSHEKHRVVQIRRSSYNDVVRVIEIENALNISGIQTYRINGFRVLFLITRPLNPKKNKISAKLMWTKQSESESFAIEGISRTMLSAEEEEELHKKLEPERLLERRQRPSPCAQPLPPPPFNNANSRKRKGIPRRSPLM
ncbi:uncharacterized protein LOC127744203 [Arachis duranensis]|uniref:Uncharacterized protein LOC107461807 n=1 Tax=Arachis duranensis TaxID=130453 RepID=A0A6P4B949_ARADU|nr:uncharacterized protein LOC107461807 [Arachis duranensis]XP_052112444.1 uncharacterized protein LOC127744203 [Arachis duranensis]